MESDMRKGDIDIDDEVKPRKKYQFDINCRFELKAESKSDAIIIAVEMLEGIEIQNIQELKCQEIVKSDD
jgi:phosphopantetheine adenylyltransferase